MGDTTAAPNTSGPPVGFSSGCRGFRVKGLDETRRSAEILLEHVLDCRRMDLYIAPIARRAGGTDHAPGAVTALALNRCNTSSAVVVLRLDLKVDRRALIPRRAPRLSPKRSSSARTGRLGKVTFGEIRPSAATPHRASRTRRSRPTRKSQSRSNRQRSRRPPTAQASSSQISAPDGLHRVGFARNIPVQRPSRRM